MENSESINNWNFNQNQLKVNKSGKYNLKKNYKIQVDKLENLFDRKKCSNLFDKMEIKRRKTDPKYLIEKLLKRVENEEKEEDINFNGRSKK